MQRGGAVNLRPRSADRREPGDQIVPALHPALSRRPPGRPSRYTHIGHVRSNYLLIPRLTNSSFGDTIFRDQVKFADNSCSEVRTRTYLRSINFV